MTPRRRPAQETTSQPGGRCCNPCCARRLSQHAVAPPECAILSLRSNSSALKEHHEPQTGQSTVPDPGILAEQNREPPQERGITVDRPNDIAAMQVRPPWRVKYCIILIIVIALCQDLPD
jgi:hypothetical protein